MAFTPTWKDVDELLNKEGLHMDDAERAALANDPEKAYSIARKKQLYKYATTDAERAKINSDAEYERNLSGYSMGSDGASYSKVETPSSFKSDYTADVRKNYEAARDYGDFTYDAFEDKYASQRAELLDAIANPEKFNYDYKDDPNYKSFAKQYRREGDRVMEDALAKAAANTGGVASSAAVTAAAQQGNYYAAQLADKIPALYDAAYKRYLDEFTMKQNALTAYQGETAADYDRYANERNFAKGVYDDKYARLIDAMNNAAALEGVDYERNLENLGYVDGKGQQALSDAYKAAEMGDFSQLKALGVDTGAYEEQLATAQLLESEAAKRKATAENLENNYLSEQLKQLKANAGTAAQQNAISMAELKASMGEYADLARLLGVSVEQVKAAYEKEPEVDPMEEYMGKAQYIRAMLMLDGSYENIPSVEDIAVLLANGFTGFDSMFEVGEAPVDYSSWGAGDWEEYFAYIRVNESIDAAQKELNDMKSKGLIPDNMITYAARGARGPLAGR